MLNVKKMFKAPAVLTSLLVLGLASPTFADNKHGKKLAVDKVKGDLSVMVLGSGGPVPTAAGRASASYLVFVDGQPKILMDAGGGAYQRLAASGTDIKDLDIVLLSHLHIDHMGDLSPIVKGMYFQNRIYNVTGEGTFPPGRTAPFRVFGPATNGAKFPNPPLVDADPMTTQYPPTTDFVHSHYDLNTGNERYLNIFSRAISGGIFNYTATDVAPNWMAYEPTTIIDEDVNGTQLVIKAAGVNHGPVPALAFRIEYAGKSIVYSGDTSSRGNNMVMLSEGADMLIYDTALFEDAPVSDAFNIFYALHTTPNRIGEVATAAGVNKLVLSHITPQTEGKGKELKAKIKAQGFTGKIKMAEDLKVFNLGD